MNLSAAEFALVIIAIYFTMHLLIALACGIKWLSKMPERRHREMIRFLDHHYEQARKEVNRDRISVERPRHRDGESSG